MEALRKKYNILYAEVSLANLRQIAEQERARYKRLGLL
jgi:hypothetical protein